MKALLIIASLFITPSILTGQKSPCTTCACILKRARETKDFEDAIKQFNSARNNCPQTMTAAIDAEIIGVFKKINQLRARAEANEKQLKIALDSTRNATERTLQSQEQLSVAREEVKILIIRAEDKKNEADIARTEAKSQTKLAELEKLRAEELKKLADSSTKQLKRQTELMYSERKQLEEADLQLQKALILTKKDRRQRWWKNVRLGAGCLLVGILIKSVIK